MKQHFVQRGRHKVSTELIKLTPQVPGGQNCLITDHVSWGHRVGRITAEVLPQHQRECPQGDTHSVAWLSPVHSRSGGSLMADGLGHQSLKQVRTLLVSS